MRNRQVTKLNKKIKIFSETETDDGFGGSSVSDKSVVCSPWAAIWPVKAKESRENMRERVTVTHTIRIHYRPGIDSTMKIQFGTRKFEIKGIINPDEANQWLDMVCNEYF